MLTAASASVAFVIGRIARHHAHVLMQTHIFAKVDSVTKAEVGATKAPVSGATTNANGSTASFRDTTTTQHHADCMICGCRDGNWSTSPAAELNVAGGQLNEVAGNHRLAGILRPVSFVIAHFHAVRRRSATHPTPLIHGDPVAPRPRKIVRALQPPRQLYLAHPLVNDQPICSPLPPRRVSSQADITCTLGAPIRLTFPRRRKPAAHC